MTIALRPTRLEDLGFVVRTEMDPENRPFLLPWSLESHRAALDSGDMAHFVIETTEDATSAGFAILAGLSNPHHSIELRRIVVNDKGRGYGARALALVKELAFLRYAAHRLWLDVKAHNQRARRVYSAARFVEEGTLRECLRSEDRFESLVVMSILDYEFWGSFATSVPYRCGHR